MSTEIKTHGYESSSNADLRIKISKPTIIADEIEKLLNLIYLELIDCGSKEIPEEIAKLTKLKKLDLRQNNFTKSEKQRIINRLPDCKILF